jgi:hypothetical protein
MGHLPGFFLNSEFEISSRTSLAERGRDKWFHGAIVGFSEQSGSKHRIKFESLKKESDCNLRKRNFRWTDLIGPRSPVARHALSTSRCMGVQRRSENRWIALNPQGRGVVNYIGMFKSEKDAALAYDVFARREDRSVNIKAEKISEAEMKVRKTTREDCSLLPVAVKGKSKFR